MADLINTLGGPLGFGENTLSRGDDLASERVDISGIFENGLNFWGEVYTSFWINTNGTVSFEAPLSSATSGTFDATTPAGIFPFWGDIDTRNSNDLALSPGGSSQGSNLIYYDLDSVNDRIVVTWDDVGSFPSDNSTVNAFQLIIFDRSSTPGRSPGDFDLEFRYEEISWSSSSYYTNSDVRIGYASGGEASNFYEIMQSGDNSQVLLLDESQGNSGEIGAWIFEVRNGGEPQIVSIEDADPVFEGDTGGLVFKIERSGDLSESLSIDWSAHGYSNSPARSDDVDGRLPMNGTITFEAGQSVQFISIPISNDLAPEHNEEILVHLIDPDLLSGLPVLFERQSASGTILDDDRAYPQQPPSAASASFFGSAGIKSFDGLLYEIHAVGEFVLLEDGSGQEFSVQVRTEVLSGALTAATAVAIEVPGARVVIDGTRSTPLSINGLRLNINPLEGPYELGDTGVSIFNEDGAYVVQLPNGAQVQVSVSDFGALNIHAHLGEASDAQSLTGLWGNANTDPWDDVNGLASGQELDPLTRSALLVAHIDSWRVTDAFDLFDRQDGESTAQWQDLDFVYETVPTDLLPSTIWGIDQSSHLLNWLPDRALMDAALLDWAFSGEDFFLEGFSYVSESGPFFRFDTGMPNVDRGIFISCESPAIIEGDQGAQEATFWVERIGDISGTLIVEYEISGQISSNDLAGQFAGFIQFSAGQTRQAISIAILGDSIAEQAEQLVVSIQASDVTLLNASAHIEILDDDSIPLVLGTNEDNILMGDAGSNVLYGYNGTDRIFGYDGDDVIYAGGGDDIIYAGQGGDFIDGGGGSDTVSFLGSTRRVLADLQEDAYYASFQVYFREGAPEGDVYISIENLSGGRSADQLRGDEGANVLEGASGSDRLYGRMGADTLVGGIGTDMIYGNQGVDVMSGGDDQGLDRFIYFRITDSSVGIGNRDIITDFDPGEDRIEISRFDANTNIPFNQQFSFVDNAQFSGAGGELRFIQDTINNWTLIQADTNGDRLPDFEIELTGIVELSSSDFIL